MREIVQCRLCDTPVTHKVAAARHQILHQCPKCRLVFVPDGAILTPAAEKQRYDLHRNHGQDPSYRAYLATFAGELERVPLTAPNILDYGAGPEYILTRILRERGLSCWPCDPLYDMPVPRDKAPFDIIAGCEVIEHLRRPSAEFAMMRELLSPGGYAVFRTELYDATTDFAAWWYANDQTHINFYCRWTLEYVAALLIRRIMYCDDKRVVIIGP